MKSKWKNLIFAILIVFVLSIPILVDYFGNKEIELLTYEDYTRVVETGEFSLIYFGDTKSEDYKEATEKLLEMKEKFGIEVKTLNLSELSDQDKEDLTETNELFDSKTGWVFVEHGGIEHIHQGKIEKDLLTVLVDKHYNNIVPKEELVYKTFKNAAAFKKVYEGKKTTMVIFGSANCSWCNAFIPVFNDAANDNNLDIYYFDSDSYDEKEFKKIMNMGIMIPKLCTTTGSAQDISEGFGTPLTLFVKGGKAVDCISGFIPKDRLNAKLKNVGIIK